MKQKKAVVAGHICLDLTPQFPPKKGKEISDILSPGKLIHMDGIDIHTGGAVANTGLAMKKLGMDVALMGKIGADEFGSLVLHILNEYGSGKEMMVASDSSTSYSIVLAVPGIDRIFLHNPGANDTFTREDVDWNTVADAALFHFGYPPLMRKMYENEGEELVALFRRVKELGTATSLDLAAVDPASEAGKADWDAILKKVLPYVDFFLPSIEEMGFMLDRERYLSWTEKARGREIIDVITMDDVRVLAEKALAYGAKAVVVKCGAPGMYYKTSAGADMEPLCTQLGLAAEEWSDKEGFEKSYVPEKVLSGTGAGDTSIAAFLSAVLKGLSLAEAMQLSAATGACCVAAYDALSGLRSLEELREKIDSGWEKNQKNITGDDKIC